MHPVNFLITGYIAIVFTGSVFLSLPFFTSNDVSYIDNLFTSTSAVSTTGLVTKNVSEDYSILGQFVILGMIQVGGIGYMSIASFIVLGQGRKLSPVNINLLNNDFRLPRLFRLDRFVKNVIIFSLIIETIGAIALYPQFRNMGLAKAIWYSIFHSVSAFCTAGFSLTVNSFESYSDNIWITIIISGLSFSGAIGFIVITDIWDYARGKKERITYTTEIILKFSFILVLVGTVLIYVTEPSIMDLPAEERLAASFFQTMTAQTTVGFNTIPIGTLNHSVVFIIIILMVIGASPSGTGGGIKSTTISAVFAQIRAVLREKKDVVFLKRIIPPKRLIQAQAIFGFYISFLCIGIFFLLLTESFTFEELVFEAASALGTVGLSMGITGTITTLGKIILVFLMFAGRVGPLSIGTSLFSERRDKIKEDDLAL